MTKIQSILYYVRALLIFVVSVFGISFFFYSSGFLEKLLAQTTHLRVTPSFNGGEIASDFFDDTGDDNGAGILCYPTNTRFVNGSLDLIRYTVHKPVYEAKWQKNPEYWQLDVEYKNGADGVRNITVYIDVDGAESGSTETLTEGAENVTFDSAHPWDFVVQYYRSVGKVYDANKNFICDTENFIQKNGACILIRIPLKDKRLQMIYNAPKTFHYVLTGGYSEWDRGRFLPIEKRKTISRGSTEHAADFSPLIPRIYDMLDDSSDKQLCQTAQLSSFNNDDFTKAVLYPVCVSMDIQSVDANSHELIDEIRKAYTENQNAQAENVRQQYESAKQNLTERDQKIDLAILAFNAGDNHNAELLLRDVIDEQPENAKALAYYGSCIAMKGGEASVIEAVTLVNDSLVYLDKAVLLAENAPEEIDVLMNRASVCESIPNGVFGKAAVAGDDYIKCANLYKKSVDMANLSAEDKLFLAYLYASASDCYKTAAKETESLMYIKEAEKLWH